MIFGVASRFVLCGLYGLLTGALLLAGPLGMAWVEPPRDYEITRLAATLGLPVSAWICWASNQAAQNVLEGRTRGFVVALVASFPIAALGLVRGWPIVLLLGAPIALYAFGRLVGFGPKPT